MYGSLYTCMPIRDRRDRRDRRNSYRSPYVRSLSVTAEILVVPPMFYLLVVHVCFAVILTVRPMLACLVRLVCFAGLVINAYLILRSLSGRTAIVISFMRRDFRGHYELNCPVYVRTSPFHIYQFLAPL